MVTDAGKLSKCAVRFCRALPVCMATSNVKSSLRGKRLFCMNICMCALTVFMHIHAFCGGSVMDPALEALPGRTLNVEW
jgi:hypothetical protein